MPEKFRLWIFPELLLQPFKFAFVFFPDCKILQNLNSLNVTCGNRLFEQFINVHKRISANLNVVRFEIDLLSNMKSGSPSHEEV